MSHLCLGSEGLLIVELILQKRIKCGTNQKNGENEVGRIVGR
jgi:hypothetical protein